MNNRKSLIIAALRAFIAQRPGMDPRNYDRTGYLKESREVTRDRHQAETLLRAVEWRDSITADALLAAAKGAYSGRLTLLVEPTHNWDKPEDGWRCRVDYCTGQYFPTEYRRAVCAVLASALWAYQRENMPAVIGYRVEAWGKWTDDGRRFEHVKHTVVANREAAEIQLVDFGGSSYGNVVELYPGNVSAGDWLRAHFAKEFGRGIASRWFS